MAKQIIVDKDDNEIGLKERSDITSEDIYRISCLWLTNSKGEIFIAQRALSKSHDPGCWGPAVAGTVDEGETYETNIIKEIKEEIGLENLPLILGPKLIRVRTEHKFFCQYYMAQRNIDILEFKVQKEEVENIKWIDRNELIRDVKENPKKYVPSMLDLLKLFYPESEYL